VVLKGHLSNPNSDLCRLLDFAEGEQGATKVGDPCDSIRERKQVQHRLPPAAIAELVASYKAGASVRQLAQRYEIHTMTVSSHLARNDVPRRGGQRRLAARQVEEAGEKYGEGWSLTRLGNYFGVSPETVRRELHLAGIEIRSRQGARNRSTEAGPHQGS
jgi:DNA-directed RNA polymerase specialized sigma24 family protein